MATCFRARGFEMMHNAKVESVAKTPADLPFPRHSRVEGGEDFTNLLPEKRRGDRVTAIAVFVVTLAYLWLFRRYTSFEPDEGIVLQGAQRILRGEVLYRDFFSFFTPGSYYLLALFFKIFGSSFAVARGALILFGGIYSAITYLLARRVCSRSSALLAAGIASVATLPFRFEVLHNWDSTLLACLALYCAVRWMESTQPQWAFALGSFTALSVLFEQSKGAGLVLGLGAGLAAITLMNRNRRLWQGNQFVLVAGFGWPFLLTFAYFGAQHSIGVLVADWLWPLRHYSLANHVPYGYQNWSESTRHLLFGIGSPSVRLITIIAISPCFLVPLLPLIAVALLFYWMVQTLRKKSPQMVASYYLLVCAVISGLLVSVVIGRADIIHFMYLLPLFSVVLAWLIDGRDIPGRTFSKVKPLFVAYVMIAFFLFSVPLLLRAVGASYRVETRRGVIAAPAPDTVTDYLQAHTALGETILVYPYLPLYYYLTETYSPSPYEYFQPGMHTPGQAAQMLGALKAQRLRVVLFEASFWEKIPNSWPSTPISDIAHDQLADYVWHEYRSCRSLRSGGDSHFLFMVRRDLPCP